VKGLSGLFIGAAYGPQCTIHVVSGSDKTKRWPKAGRSSAPAFFEGFGITANGRGLGVSFGY